ncbi:MAG: hypothetical protein ACYDDF_08935 [Thermoplasmatota archaeon]
MCVRGDLAGVTSWVRAAYLTPESYQRLLHLFESSAVDLDLLTMTWVSQAKERFDPIQVEGHLVLAADGLKIPKEGRR